MIQLEPAAIGVQEDDELVRAAAEGDRRAFGELQPAGSLSGNADFAAGGGDDRARNRAADGPQAGIRPRKSVPGHEDASPVAGGNGKEMSDEYLWDRTGSPDPEIKRLERVLAPLAHGARPARTRRPPYWLAAAAAAALAALGLMRFATPAAPPTAWQVAEPRRHGARGRQGCDGRHDRPHGAGSTNGKRLRTHFGGRPGGPGGSGPGFGIERGRQ